MANASLQNSIPELQNLQTRLKNFTIILIPLFALSFANRLDLSIQILLGLVMGTIFGSIDAFHDLSLELSIIKILFLNMIHMLVPLLIFSSMTMGIMSIKDPKKLGRVGLKTISYYLITTLIAVFIGFFIAYLIQPGAGIDLSHEYLSQNTITSSHSIDFSISGLTQIIIPSNMFSAFLQGNYVQIIFFALFLGWSINTCGDRGRPLLKSIRSLVEVLYKMLGVVMKITPYAVYAMMASTVSTFGFKMLLGLFMYLFCIYLGCMIHILITNSLLLLRLKGRLNPIHFYRGMKDAIIVSFSTASSNASLSTSLHCVEEKLGVSKNIANFILPLGATVNMNGAALSMACTVVFIAQANGIDLGMGQIVTATLTSTLSAIGAAGIPGSGGAMMEVVVGAAGLPTAGIAALWGVNNIREMMSATTNILGDSAVSVVIAKEEKELDIDKYNEEMLKEFEESNL